MLNQSTLMLVKRNIKYRGSNFIFKVFSYNEFGEKTNETNIIELKGIFHQEQPPLKLTEGESGRTLTEPSPALLVLHDDYILNPVTIDDTLEYNNKKFKVTGVTNILEKNIVIDIFLEVV